MPTPLAKVNLDWLVNDPTGQMVGAAGVVVVALIALYYSLRAMRWAAGHLKQLMLAAVVIGLAFWGCSFLQPTLTTWVILGFIGFGAFVGFALYMTRG